VTMHGAEVIESQDNWNYTRSILFGYAIPFYHVGVRGTVAASDKVSFAGYLVNGWNNSSELNGEKTFAINATLKPSPRFTWYLNYMGGKEVEGGDTRNLFDTTASLALGEKFTVMGNFDYGKEGDVKWWGVAGYAKLQAAPNWALAGRYEYIDDTEGGFMLLGTKAQTITVTSDHLIAGGLKARLEYRTDFADDDVFPDEDGTFKDSQTTLTVGLVYSFGGKI
jgi:Putative beta-barrel porin-2, OmpL-like. bbp2